MKNKRLLFITRKYPPSVGGMQQHCFDFYQEVSKQTPTTLIAHGGSQIFLPLFILKALALGIWWGLKQRGKERTIVLGDALLSPLGALLTFLLSSRLIVITHGLDITYPALLYQKAVLHFLRSADSIFANSQFTKNLLIEKQLAAPESISILHPRVPPLLYPLLSRENAREELIQLRSNTIPQFLLSRAWIFSLGRLIERKGLLNFIENIFPSISQANSKIVLLIGGEGPLKSQIEASISRRHLSSKIFLLGEVSNLEKHLLFCASNVFIMPNLSIPNDPEGFGITVLEALSFGLPVVGSDLQGLGESVRYTELGIPVPCYESDRFSKAVVAAVTAPLNEESEKYRNLIVARQIEQWKAALQILWIQRGIS